MIRLASFVLVLASIGCGSTEPTAPPIPIGKSGPPTGNAVFDTHCSNCHSTQATGAPTSGPNLSKVGGNRSAEWLADHVKNPKSHKPQSMMPEFGSKLNADELKSVTDFMTGLK